MHGLEVADPYVERLLEGGRVSSRRACQLKIDAEFPRFTQALLEIVYPHYLAPTPSMLIATGSSPMGTTPTWRVVPTGAAPRAAPLSSVASPVSDATAC